MSNCTMGLFWFLILIFGNAIASFIGYYKVARETGGAYHLTENFGNSGLKVNGKVTFRKFRPKIEEYVLR